MAQSKSTPASKQDDWTWDPTYVASLRELWMILAFFALMLSYTIGASFYFGYPEDKNTTIAMTWGIPQWFLIGVAAPWGGATLLSVLFALFYMTDHDAPDEAISEAIISEQSSEVRT